MSPDKKLSRPLKYIPSLVLIEAVSDCIDELDRVRNTNEPSQTAFHNIFQVQVKELQAVRSKWLHCIAFASNEPKKNWIAKNGQVNIDDIGN